MTEKSMAANTVSKKASYYGMCAIMTTILILMING